MPPFTLASGGNVAVMASMTDVSQSNAIALDYRGSQFAQAVSQGNPNQVATGEGFFDRFFAVLAQPGTAEDGFFGANADLLLVSDPDGTDMNTGVMNYGSPTVLSGNWGVLFDVRFVNRVIPPALPGTIGVRPGLRYGEFIEWTTTTAAAEAAPITPPVSAPTAITLGGYGFYAGGTGIGTTPTLAWSPGGIGNAPAFYKVTVSELFADAQNRTAARTIARILTPNTWLTFPPDILVSGRSYVILLTAVTSTSPEGAALLAVSPFKTGLDIAVAQTVSGVFVP
ncbi:MAG: hypothetical protein ACREIV_09940 [Planctomycetaceae bacterium]